MHRFFCYKFYWGFGAYFFGVYLFVCRPFLHKHFCKRKSVACGYLWARGPRPQPSGKPNTVYADLLYY